MLQKNSTLHNRGDINGWDIQKKKRSTSRNSLLPLSTQKNTGYNVNMTFLQSLPIYYLNPLGSHSRLSAWKKKVQEVAIFVIRCHHFHSYDSETFTGLCLPVSKTSLPRKLENETGNRRKENVMFSLLIESQTVITQKNKSTSLTIHWWCWYIFRTFNTINAI